jgi:hypothetical protein
MVGRHALFITSSRDTDFVYNLSSNNHVSSQFIEVIHEAFHGDRQQRNLLVWRHTVKIIFEHAIQKIK